jgi:hypothetical protein
LLVDERVNDDFHESKGSAFVLPRPLCHSAGTFYVTGFPTE